MAMMSKTRQELADMFLAALKENQIPWRATWSAEKPHNPVSKVTYRGVNRLMLDAVARDRGYTDPRWCTFNQAKDQGWHIQKGAKAVRVEYWAFIDPEAHKMLSWEEVRRIRREDPDRFEKLQLRCRTSCVFNGEQIDGIPEYNRSRGTDIGSLRRQRDTLLQNMRLDYREGGTRAYYSPGADQVTLPPEASFDSPYGYFCTFLHECGHATGHASRLNRDLSGGFGSEAYAREELRAEIASAFTAQELGLVMPEEEIEKHLDLHKAYIQSWIEALETDPNELFAAIKDAGVISDYLIERGEFSREEVREEVREETQGQLKEPVSFRAGGQQCTITNLPGGGCQMNVQGQGTLENLEDSELWRKLRAGVRAVTIGEGITVLGSRALGQAENLEKISLPQSLEEIGYCALNDSPKLREVQFQGSLEQWDAVHKAYGFLPEQFANERAFAEKSRLSVPFDRGLDAAMTVQAESGGISLVAEQISEIREERLPAARFHISEFREKDLVFLAHVEGPNTDRWTAVRSQGERMYARLHTGLGGAYMDYEFSEAEKARYLEFEQQAMAPVQQEAVLEVQVMELEI